MFRTAGKADYSTGLKRREVTPLGLQTKGRKLGLIDVLCGALGKLFFESL